MEVRQIVNSLFRSCSYVIVHDGASWLVDCGDVDKILPAIVGPLKGVLLTHAHFDHIYGLNQLAELIPSLSVFTNEPGREALLSDKLNLSKYNGDPFVLIDTTHVHLVENGECVNLFDGIKAEAVFTPGHNPSCVTWMIGDMILTGDSFIPGVKTVTNLPLSDKALAAKSEVLIRELAAHRTVYAGHAPEV